MMYDIALALFGALGTPLAQKFHVEPNGLTYIHMTVSSGVFLMPSILAVALALF